MGAIGRSSGVIVSMAVSAVLLTATAQAAPPSPIVDYGASGYRYLEVPTGGGPADFAAVGFDDSAFSTGTAPFGDDAVFCPLAPTTKWSRETDLLVRRSVSLPAGTTDVMVHVAIDNDFDLFWNGTNVASIVSEGCAVLDSFVVAIPDALLSAGPNVLAARARDRGLTSYFDLRVTANLPPSCAAVGLTSTRLWPPNHTLRTISASGGVDPEGGDLTVAIAGVTQDEPLDGLADGHTSPDASVDGLAENQVRLRAERSGLGDGRVYRVEVTATDPDGASCTKTILVGVPHDTRGSQPVDTTSVVVDSFGPAPVAAVATPVLSAPSADTPSGSGPVEPASTVPAPTERRVAVTVPAPDPAPPSHEPQPTPTPADPGPPAGATRGGHGGPPERVAARHP
jgi:hypothetical protein